MAHARWMAGFNRVGDVGDVMRAEVRMSARMASHTSHHLLPPCMQPKQTQHTRLGDGDAINDTHSTDTATPALRPPSTLSPLPPLRPVTIHAMHVTGPLPPSWSELTNLQGLYTSTNTLTGATPCRGISGMHRAGPYVVMAGLGCSGRRWAGRGKGAWPP